MKSSQENFDIENSFYLSCDASRIGKIIAQNELYKKIINIPGEIIELGVFKGASFSRFAMLRNIYEHNSSRKIIGFDTFGKFPETSHDDDKYFTKLHNDISSSIKKTELLESLNKRGIDEGIELIEGNIVKTLPDYISEHPELKISLLNLDTDVYEPAVTTLEELFPRVCKGGVIIIDNYAKVPGETKAVDDFFKHNNITINKFPYSSTPCFIIK
tara:strand:+ start:3214 stop:3858 length:645 start_codon:yes stop_codon:yes gene_type:complete